MTRVLICWEDQHNAKLDLCLRRTLRKLDPERQQPLELHRQGVRGYGNFAPFLRDQWPDAATKGSPGSSGPIDYILCIADADKAIECCDIEAPPKAPAKTDEWLKRANDAFTRKLRAATNHASDRISGHFLRWSLESLLIAAFDVETALRKLGCKDAASLQAFLRSCKPPPTGIGPELFVDHYRKPHVCFDELLAANGTDAKRLRKGSPSRDDVLEILSTSALDGLTTRVPDLVAIARFLQALA